MYITSKLVGTVLLGILLVIVSISNYVFSIFFSHVVPYSALHLSDFQSKSKLLEAFGVYNHQRLVYVIFWLTPTVCTMATYEKCRLPQRGRRDRQLSRKKSEGNRDNRKVSKLQPWDGRGI